VITLIAVMCIVLLAGIFGVRHSLDITPTVRSVSCSSARLIDLVMNGGTS
jgi:hypothetical protein